MLRTCTYELYTLSRTYELAPSQGTEAHTYSDMEAPKTQNETQPRPHMVYLPRRPTLSFFPTLYDHARRCRALAVPGACHARQELMLTAAIRRKATTGNEDRRRRRPRVAARLTGSNSTSPPEPKRAARPGSSSRSPRRLRSAPAATRCS